MYINLKDLNKTSHLSPLGEGPDALVLGDIASRHGNGLVHIARDDKRMAHMAESLMMFYPKLEIIQIPAWDCLPYDRISPAHHVSAQRLDALCRIVASGGISKGTIVITTVNSLLQYTLPTDRIEHSTVLLKKGTVFIRDKLIHHLISCGYTRSATANESGEFAVRGSIIDLVPSGSEEGYRLDFFGDEVESIRLFDPLTQVSHKKAKELMLKPASEVVMDKRSISLFRDKYREHFGQVAGDDPLYDAISEGRTYPGMEHWLPLFYESTSSLLDLLPHSLVSLDHLYEEARNERLETIRDYFNARNGDGVAAFTGNESYRPIAPELLYMDEDYWNSSLATRQLVHINPFHSDLQSNELETHIDLSFSSSPNFSADAKASKQHAFDLLSTFLQGHKNTTNIIACYSPSSLNRMQSLLAEHDIQSQTTELWSEAITAKAGVTTLLPLRIDQGFKTNALTVITEGDLLGTKVQQKAQKRKRSDKFLTEASNLNEGEVVVHKEHGLGMFEALETLTIGGEQHDCLRIIYHGGDKLYVPVENIDLLSRYGNDQEDVRLDKLGQSSWQARKAGLKKKLLDIAGKLIDIAAKRELRKCDAVEPMAGAYEEFCARFPYAETEDQLRCIEDVSNDLASGQPMDRLICGDVGFGKTEVALRAAFMVASDHAHKQVAIIAPTTLLARQHLQTFKQRFAGFPFEVHGLSRLTPASEAKKIKQGLKEGKVDIVVGTHALLAKSIEFKNLGLVIIDEEQQFGVVQKERFKEFRADIHMLTLSATPIPRTLQMSLTGIKELSLIATPPVDRLAIRSYTMPFDSVVIRNAILREHYRGGRTFFVVPRIKDLDEIQNKLSTLIPEVNIVQAHGKLTPAVLDQTMNDFYDGKYDVLLSTNIIGSGIDLATANTIVIHRADMFGLAQLYQMRGRVGRSKVRAYAYFTTPPKKIPNPTALKRLEVMQNLDSLGAGFTLASHDMDIRGFGNLLGDQQSGQIKEVGVELYQEMLREAIEQAKANEQGTSFDSDDWSPHINLGISVLIPAAYIPDLELRLSFYRQLGQAASNDEIDQLVDEMVDRFGKLPDEVLHLVDIMHIKYICRSIGVEKVEAGEKGIVIAFRGQQFANPEALLSYINKNRERTKVRSDQSIFIKHPTINSAERLVATKNALTTMTKLAANQ